MHKLQATSCRTPVPTPLTPISSLDYLPTQNYRISAQVWSTQGTFDGLTNNPARQVGLDGYGLHHRRVPRSAGQHEHPLQVSVTNWGHDLAGLNDFHESVHLPGNSAVPCEKVAPGCQICRRWMRLVCGWRLSPAQKDLRRAVGRRRKVAMVWPR